MTSFTSGLQANETPSGASMFCCQQCGSQEFNLLLRADLIDNLSTEITPAGDLLIKVGERNPFVADLSFMNRYSSCKACGATKSWAYCGFTEAEVTS
jgi:hypothetical protein